MTQNWDYAELSKAAKAAGGPEIFIDKLEQASKKSGKIEMLPWLALSALCGGIIYKTIDFFKSKKKKNEKEIEYAKKEIINGINDYDAIHSNEDKIAWRLKMTREELKEQIDELMRQYSDEEIDGNTYAQKMMELTTSAQKDCD